MKVSKKIVLVLVLVMISGTNVFAFTDIKTNDETAKAINLMAEYKIVNGYEDGTFKPEKEVTRAEFIKMTNKLFSYNEKAISESFNDVNEKNWYYDEVLKAINEGYILGYADGTFRPEDKITKEQICVILDRILKLENTVAKKDLAIKDKVSSWAANSVNRVINSEIINLDENKEFKATVPANRGMVALAYSKIVEKKLVILKKEENTTSAAIGGASADIEDNTKDEDKAPSEEIIETMKLASKNIRTTGARYLTKVEDRSDLVPFLENVSSEIDKYVKDTDYDLKEAMKKTKKIYDSKSKEDRALLKNAVSSSFDLTDKEQYKALQEVAKFFGVDVDKVK